VSDDAFLSVAGKRATDATIRVPQVGAWIADVPLDGDDIVTGKVTLKVGAVAFVGTIDEKFSGAYDRPAKQRALRIVGAAGWSKVIGAQHWHNDAGVKLSQVLTSSAAAAGETIDVATDTRLGADYVRRSGPASATLRDLAPAWYVRRDGTTSTGPRLAPTPGKFELLNFDPGQNVAEIGTLEVDAVDVGAVLRDSRFEKSLTVRQLEIRVHAGAIRLVVWGTT